MMNVTTKKVMKFSYLAGAAMAAALLLRRETGWASGLMIGVIWSVFNYSLTLSIFEIALLKKDPKRMGLILMLKFPALYLAGFLILRAGLFPEMSILAGIGLVLLVIGIVNIWPKRA